MLLEETCPRRTSIVGLSGWEAGSIGVLRPVTRKHYIDFLSEFELAAEDARTFGEVDATGGRESLLIIFKRVGG